MMRTTMRPSKRSPILASLLAFASLIALPAFGQSATAPAAAQSSPAATPEAARGQQIAGQVCAACHGADGNSVIPVNPKLAGQPAAYIAKQLADFKPANGKVPARVNPVMNGIAAALSEADMKALGAYYAQQKPALAQARNKATLEYGQRLWRTGDAKRGLPACASCHGATGAGIPGQYPRLSGQHAEYTEAQLKLFRAGAELQPGEALTPAVRTNDLNLVMRTIAARMSDRDIRAVSDYAAGLR